MFRSLLAGILCLFAGSVHAQSEPITGATCVSTGVVQVRATIVVASGVFDGGCKTYVPFIMDAGSHSEETARQALMFKVENGAKLRNLIIDGVVQGGTARAIEIRNGATLENVYINTAYTPNDAVYIAIRSAGAVIIDSVTAIGQLDLNRLISANGAGTTVKVTNSIFTKAIKIFRQTSGSTYATAVSFDRCDFSDVPETIARTDSPAATAVVTNSRLHNVRQICLNYAPDNCVASGNSTH